MSGIGRLVRAKKTDPSFNVGVPITEEEMSQVPPDKAKGPKMQSFQEMNMGSKKVS